MTVTIYHNPKCGTSRNVLAMIRQSGEEPVVIEYLKNPPTGERGLPEGSTIRARWTRFARSVRERGIAATPHPPRQSPNRSPDDNPAIT